jgi:hypothetical protein
VGEGLANYEGNRRASLDAHVMTTAAPLEDSAALLPFDGLILHEARHYHLCHGKDRFNFPATCELSILHTLRPKRIPSPSRNKQWRRISKRQSGLSRLFIFI